VIAPLKRHCFPEPSGSLWRCLAVGRCSDAPTFGLVIIPHRSYPQRCITRWPVSSARQLPARSFGSFVRGRGRFKDSDSAWLVCKTASPARDDSQQGRVGLAVRRQPCARRLDGRKRTTTGTLSGVLA
jgi:hypothetical protein